MATGASSTHAGDRLSLSDATKSGVRACVRACVEESSQPWQPPFSVQPVPVSNNEDDSCRSSRCSLYAGRGCRVKKNRAARAPLQRRSLGTATTSKSILRPAGSRCHQHCYHQQHCHRMWPRIGWPRIGGTGFQPVGRHPPNIFPGSITTSSSTTTSTAAACGPELGGPELVAPASSRWAGPWRPPQHIPGQLTRERRRSRTARPIPPAASTDPPSRGYCGCIAISPTARRGPV
jgi:hypothetical protein